MNKQVSTFLYKNINFIVLLIYFFISIPLHIIANSHSNSPSIQDNIIRFHVIANSDFDYDQELKLKIKDEINKQLAPYLENVNDINLAKETLINLLPFIKNIADKIISENNYEYKVDVSFTSSYFPVKSYGSFIFPAGYYNAVNIKIGKAEGKNWWCVMFPPLCLVDETYSIVSKESEEKLQYILSEEELYDLQNSNYKVKYKFKIYEYFRKMLK